MSDREVKILSCSGGLDGPLINVQIHWLIDVSGFGYIEAGQGGNGFNPGQISDASHGKYTHSTTVLKFCGNTRKTDDEIRAIVKDWNDGKNGGQGNHEYSFNTNNCQHFVVWALKRLGIPMVYIPTVNVLGATALRLETPCGAQIRAFAGEASGEIGPDSNGSNIGIRGQLEGAVHGTKLASGVVGYEVLAARAGVAAQAGQSGVTGRYDLEGTLARGNLGPAHGKVGLDVGSEFSFHDDRGFAIKFLGFGIGCTNEDGANFSCPLFKFGLGGSRTG